MTPRKYVSASTMGSDTVDLLTPLGGSATDGVITNRGDDEFDVAYVLDGVTHDRFWLPPGTKQRFPCDVDAVEVHALNGTVATYTVVGWKVDPE